MADYGTYDTTNLPTGPEKPRTFGLKIISDVAILRRNGWGDTLTKVAGSTRLYDAGGGSMGMKIIQDDASTEVEALGGEYVLRAELDCAGNSGIALKYPKAKAVATGSLLAVAAGNEGVQEWDSTIKRPVFGANAGGRRLYAAGYDIDGGHFKRMQLDIDVPVTNPPATRVANDVTGWTFDDATDNLVLITREPLPFEFTGGHNGYLELMCRLVDAETGTDIIDFQADYETKLVGAGAFGGATTNNVNTAVTIGAGTAAGTLHRVLIPLVYNDATNPLAADRMLRAVLKRNGIATIPNVDLLYANLLIPVRGGVDYQI
jgi:hypothetical protein